MKTHPKHTIMVVTDIQTPFESLDDAVIHISALDKTSYPVGLKFQDGHVKWFVTALNFDEFVTYSPIFKKLRDSAKMWQSIEKRSQSYVF